MSIVLQPIGGLSVEEYLEGEMHAELRHEYFAGQTVAGPFGWRHEVLVEGAFRLACLDVEVALADVFADLTS